MRYNHLQQLSPSRWLLHIYKFNYTNSLVCRSRILVCASQFYLRSGTYIFPIKIWNCLYDRFLFKFVLLCHIFVVYTNISFCERLSSNPFSCIFVTFHYSCFYLVWFHIILCSITYVNFYLFLSHFDYLF